jgi:hypothetical protein
MQTLRNCTLITRLVLVWFALFIGSAMASTVMKPSSLQMVCSGAGSMTLVDVNDQEGDTRISPSLDCPLCTSVSAPPPPLAVAFDPPCPLRHALRPIAAAHIAYITAAPLPSRGPPTSLL